MPLAIDGLSEKEYPQVYRAIKNIGDLYGIKHIYIKRPWYAKNIRMWCQARAHSLAFSDWVLNFFENEMEQKEVEALIAHEFSHISNRDTYRQCMFYVFLLPLIILLSALLSVWFGQKISLLYQYGLYIQNIVVTYVPYHSYALVMALSVLFFLAGLRVALSFTRGCEKRSDREAILRTGDADSYKAALTHYASKALASDNRFEQAVIFLNRNLIFKLFGRTHPTLNERLEYADSIRDHLLNDHEVASDTRI